jgi:hypothetical protein
MDEVWEKLRSLNAALAEEDTQEETEMVGDGVEVDLLGGANEAFSPEYIADVVVPELDAHLAKNGFRLKGYYLWPEYRIGGSGN